MNKQKQGRKLHRMRDQRKALLKSLARALILNGKIETTEPKAKELRVFVEPLITSAKTDTIHKRRVIARIMGSNQEDVIAKLFSEVGTKYKERSGGYTRIIKKNNRRGDDASMAVIEFV